MSDRRAAAGQVVWVAAAAVVGFLVAAVFSAALGMRRATYLVPYVLIVGAFLVAYFRAHPLSVGQILRAWPAGLILAAAASWFLVRNVHGQPPSAVPAGASLAAALLWPGLVYGVVDGLFLNVMPVAATRRAWPLEGAPGRWVRLARAITALAASLLVTAGYHLGYIEFRGAVLASVLLGNAVITLTYVLSGSPLAPTLTHVAMHLAAVLHGMETTLQLPPHY